MAEPGSLIQEGIYFRAGERAPASYRLVVFDVRPGANAGDVAHALERMWVTLAQMRDGTVRDLGELSQRHAKEIKAQYQSLRALVGFGASAFADREHGPPLATSPRPDFLVRLNRKGRAFPALPWSADPTSQGEGDIAVQLTADRADAVNCAAVELCTLIADDELALAAVGSFDGAGRQDGRGWLGFHDGVSNIETSQRATAMEAGADPPWMQGGTYMAFLRLAVDLAAWRALSRETQELLVGRDKQTGSGLVAVDRQSGAPRPVAAPDPGDDMSDAELADYQDPPQSTDPLLEASHVHRANQNRSSPHAAAGLRMFRQGYDYLDTIGPDGPRLGLNFVSFQSNLSVLEHVLHLPGWLGDVNFGGPSEPGDGEPGPPSFIALDAGGFYAVPPRATPFPGASLFKSG